MHWLAAWVVAALGVPAGVAVSAAVARAPGARGRAVPLAPRAGVRFGPVVLTVVVFGLLGLRFGASPALPAFCYLAAAGVALGFIDARHRRLPDVLTLTAYPAALVLLGAAAIFLPNGSGLLVHGLGGAVLAAAFYLLLAAVHPAGLGWGDVKLSGVLGLYLGWLGARTFVAGLAGGFVLAAVAGIVLIRAGRASRKTQLPFGPFMLAAALAAVLASPLLAG